MWFVVRVMGMVAWGGDALQVSWLALLPVALRG
ncbi:MAG: hypothetical protein H6Q20_1429 [Bacteroidetes bacterium]|nr:hypothetical protein [Bacteroidota bacterium]